MGVVFVALVTFWTMVMLCGRVAACDTVLHRGLVQLHMMLHGHYRMPKQLTAKSTVLSTETRLVSVGVQLTCSLILPIKCNIHLY